MSLSLSKISPIFFKDFYKTDHRRQYPEGTELIYSNFTARESRLKGVDHVVFFGLQYFIQEYLINQFSDNFFGQPKEKVISLYKRRMDSALGPGKVATDHIEALHDLGYLPLEIKALPEGTVVPLRIPLLTIKNTHPDFFWLVNFIETLLSVTLWHPITSATIAYEYRKLLTKYAKETSDKEDFVDWQAHDFSMRGQTSLESAIVSGGAHLLSFNGTDTIPSIDFMEIYYGADATNEIIGGSVPATEHSVMCMGGKNNERETYKRLMETVYPSGILSIVSDTWDYWNVLTNILPSLKEVIMAREGTIVVRPDSGDPIKIICGDPEAPENSPQRKGTLEILWETFGGTINSKGFRQLDSHIGCIYGDSITLERCEKILEGMRIKGFASTNMVFGVGSFTYQYVTRDTFGFAVKSTYGVINGTPYEIFKKPATDNGVKFSAKGLLKVNNDLTLSESVSPSEENTGLLETVFLNDRCFKFQTLKQIRSRLRK